MDGPCTGAAAERITGWGVGIEGTAFCTYCKTELTEGDRATAYAYRALGERPVSVARLYCAECDRHELERPSRGCLEWLADARLVLTSDVANQSHRLTLADVEIVDESGPREGSEP